jgi:D-alanine transaminase
VPEAHGDGSGIFDRGFLFGDAVYEVTAAFGGRMVDNDLHLARLERSLGELAYPDALAARRSIEADPARADRAERPGARGRGLPAGVARRSRTGTSCGPRGMAPVLVGFTQARTLVETARAARGDRGGSGARPALDSGATSRR